jgi:intergrase/recombinase
LKNNLDKIFDLNIDSFLDLINAIYDSKSVKYLVLSFRKWISFCEDYELLDNQVILKLKTRIKVKSKSSIDSYVPNKGEISLFLDSVKDYGICEYLFVKLLIESGCRISELINMIDTYDKSKIEFVDNIVIYRLFHIRGSKQAYYLFFTRETFDLFISNFNVLPSLNIDSFKTKIKRGKLISLKYLRKYSFTLMLTCGISFEIANFIQGRVSQDIGFNHYLAKKEIAVKEYKKIKF